MERGEMCWKQVSTAALAVADFAAVAAGASAAAPE
jgi:hypothetical protein